MKKFLTILAVAVAAVLLMTAAKPKDSDLRQVICQTSLHCKNCAAKIQDNVSFEKGVKDLTIDVDAKTVTIIYKSSKTDADKLAEAIRKLGYKVEVIEDKAL